MRKQGCDYSPGMTIVFFWRDGDWAAAIVRLLLPPEESWLFMNDAFNLIILSCQLEQASSHIMRNIGEHPGRTGHVCIYLITPRDKDNSEQYEAIKLSKVLNTFLLSGVGTYRMLTPGPFW